MCHGCWFSEARIFQFSRENSDDRAMPCHGIQIYMSTTINEQNGVRYQCRIVQQQNHSTIFKFRGQIYKRVWLTLLISVSSIFCTAADLTKPGYVNPHIQWKKLCSMPAPYRTFMFTLPQQSNQSTFGINDNARDWTRAINQRLILCDSSAKAKQIVPIHFTLFRCWKLI